MGRSPRAERRDRMLESLLLVAGQVLTLFLLMGIGFLLARIGKLTEKAVSELSFLVLYIVIPSAIIQSFQVERTAELIRTLLMGGAVMAVFYGIHLAVGQLCYRKQPLDIRGPMRFSQVYCNTGFMGLPLLSAILGEEALIFGGLAIVMFNLFQWTHGVRIMGGRVSLKSTLVNPGTVGLAVGLFLFLTGWRFPGPVSKAIGYVSDLNTPLAMMVVGAQMARADLKSTFTRPILYGSALYKLAAAPAIVLLVLLPLKVDPILFCACVILNATPTAGVTGMLAQTYGRDTVVSAQTVTLSTLLSILTLPVFATLARTLTGI